MLLPRLRFQSHHPLSNFSLIFQFLLLVLQLNPADCHNIVSGSGAHACLRGGAHARGKLFIFEAKKNKFDLSLFWEEKGFVFADFNQASSENYLEHNYKF